MDEPYELFLELDDPDMGKNNPDTEMSIQAGSIDLTKSESENALVEEDSPAEFEELILDLDEFENRTSAPKAMGSSESDEPEIVFELDELEVDDRDADEETLFELDIPETDVSVSESEPMVNREQENEDSNISGEIPTDLIELEEYFRDILEQTKRKVVIVIDAVNQLQKEENAREMRWLPERFPENVCVVVSLVEDKREKGEGYDIEADTTALNAMRKRPVKPFEISVAKLSEVECKDIINSYLSLFNKALMPDMQDILVRKQEAYNPLYLAVALEELRVFSKHEELKDFLQNRIPDNVVDMFDFVLNRVEKDLKARFEEKDNRNLFKEFMVNLATGRDGMYEADLRILLGDWQESKDREESEVRLSDYYWGELKRSMRAYLFSRGDKWDFFHQQLKQAVGNRYLPDKEKRYAAHKTIADYLELMGYQHMTTIKDLPHHLIKAGENGGAESGEWNRLENVLCDLRFIEAKCKYRLVYELVGDYAATLDALPEAQGENEKEIEHEERINKYVRDLIAYARGEIDKLEIVPSVKPWSGKEIGKDTERIINNPTRLDRIRTFSQFVIAESHILLKVGSMPNFCIQHAYNYARSGPVAVAAEHLIDTEDVGVLLLLPSTHRSEYNPHPALLKTIEINTLEGHTDGGFSVSITPDGKTAVSGSEDNTLRVWDIESGQCLRALQGHTDGGFSVSITPDGKTAVSGSEDNTLGVWDIESGECLRALGGHTDGGFSVSITPDGKTAVSGSLDLDCLDEAVSGSVGLDFLNGGGDSTLQVWDIETKQCLRTFEGHTDGVFSVSITSDGKTAVSASRDKTLRVWDIKSGQCLRALEGHTDGVFSVSITSDGRRAVSGSRDKTFRVWDIESGRCLRTLEGHTKGVFSVSITSDGRRAVSGSEDKTLRVWDIETGRCLRTLEGHTKGVFSVSITSDGRRAVSASRDKTLRVWDIESGKSNRTLGGGIEWFESSDFALDGKVAIIASGHNSLHVWDSETHRPIRTLKGHKEKVTSVSNTPDGKTAVSASEDKTLRVWDIVTGQCLHSLKHPYHIDSMRISTDGKIAILQNFDGPFAYLDIENGEFANYTTFDIHKEKVTSVSITPNGKIAVSKCARYNLPSYWNTSYNPLMVWDIESGRCLHTLEGHIHEVYSVIITPDGKTAVSRGFDIVLVWNIDTGQCLRTLESLITSCGGISITSNGKMAVLVNNDNTVHVWDIETGQCLRTLEGHIHEVHSVSITPDGNMAVSGSGDKTLRVWDIKSGQCLRALEGHTSSVFSVSITPDGNMAVSGSGDKTLRVWDIKSGQCLRALEGHTSSVFSVSITPDGNMAVSGSGDKTLRVWDIKSGQCLRALEGHTSSVFSVSITPDGNMAVSGSKDETLRVWDIKSRQCLRTLEGHADDVNSVSITPDGKTAVSGSDDCTLRVWDIKSGKCLRTLEGHTKGVIGVSITPDGKRAVSRSSGLALRSWNIETGRSFSILEDHTYPESKSPMIVTPDGKTVVLGGGDDNGAKTFRVRDIETGQCLRTLEGHTKGVLSVIVTPDGKTAVSGSKDETLRVWDIESGQCLRTFEGHTEQPKSITPDGKTAILWDSEDETNRVWDIESGQCLRTLESNFVIVTPDGKTAVSVSYDNSLCVWDIESGQCVRTLEGHTSWVSCVSITPDGKTAVSGSGDKTLRVWDISTGQRLVIFHAHGPITSVSATKAQGIAFGSELAEVVFLTFHNLPIEPPVVTPVRIWLSGVNGSSGEWDGTIKTTCKWCGRSSPVNNEILDVITSITRNAGLAPDQSPCLELPREAWDEPRLLSECPLCNKPLKFNPFMVDNRDL